MCCCFTGYFPRATDVKFGFTKSTLNVREGESIVVTVGFLDHDIVDISVSLTHEFLMGSSETGNAQSK